MSVQLMDDWMSVLREGNIFLFITTISQPALRFTQPCIDNTRNSFLANITAGAWSWLPTSTQCQDPECVKRYLLSYTSVCYDVDRGKLYV